LWCFVPPQFFVCEKLLRSFIIANKKPSVTAGTLGEIWVGQKIILDKLFHILYNKYMKTSCKIKWILCLFIVLFACLSNNIKAQETIDNRIVIKYSHSRRIPHHQIICTLYKTNNGEYKMHIETIAMVYQEQNWNMKDEKTRKYVESEEYINSQIQLKNRMEEFAKDNINIIMDIDKNFFENISIKIWNINLIKIIQENKNTIGLDGSNIIIEYGSFQYFMSINVWNPRNTKGEVEKINEIVLEVFKKANVDQWYN